MALERRLAGQFQVIKRPLVAAASSKAGESVNSAALMIASALPGEGKTFTSLNLAQSLALEKDIEVLLVDADVRKPHVSRLLGVSNEPGLLELLSDPQLHPDSVILESNVPGLKVLPAGRPSTPPPKYFPAIACRSWCVCWRPRAAPHRVVRFATVAALDRARHCRHMADRGRGARRVTPQKAVMEAVEALGRANKCSLVLNQSNTAGDTSYYGYGSYGMRPGKRTLSRQTRT